MKSRFALLALMAVSVAPLAAQGGGGAVGAAGGGQAGGQGGRGQGGRGGAQNFDALNTTYGFSAEQKPKVEEAIKTRDAVLTPMNVYRQALMQAAQAGGATGGRGGFAPLPADSQAKVDKANTDFQTALKAILTGPQIAKFDSLATAAANRRGGGGGGAAGGRGGGGGGGGI